MASSHLTRSVLLNTWKEVSAYLGRSVRTVQRWEKYGLPVRRLSASSRAAVVARAEDIDGWVRAAESHGFQTTPLTGLTPADLIQQSQSLRFESRILLSELRKSIRSVVRMVASLHESFVPFSAAPGSQNSKPVVSMKAPTAPFKASTYAKRNSVGLNHGQNILHNGR
jgi:hypothetical protein